MKRLIAVVLTVVMVCTISACGSSGNSYTTASPETPTPAPEETEAASLDDSVLEDGEHAGLHMLGPDFTDLEITDEDAAINAASESGEALGYMNALDDLGVLYTVPLDGEVYYRLQQCYKGIPVYGRTVVVAASDTGEALWLSADAADLPEDLDLAPSVTDEELWSAVAEYALYEWGYASADMDIPSLSDEELVIYDQDGEARLAYDLSVEHHEVVVDAKTAEVLDSVELLSNLTATTTASDQTTLTAPAEYSDEEQANILYDDSRNIYIYDLYKKNGQKHANVEKYAKQVTSKDDLIFGNTDEETKQEPEKAFRLLNLVGEVRDYFTETYEIRTGWPLYIVYNDGYDSGNNAMGGYDSGAGSIYTGYNMTGEERDILAHEFTHVIEEMYDCATGSGKESEAIREGLADVFSDLYRGDWMFYGKKSERNAANPSENGYPESLEDTGNNAGGDYRHTYSTIISHAAYLMQESGKFTDDELKQLWYLTMVNLPVNCSYANLRVGMERVAAFSHRQNYTDTQRLAIAEAFDKVGITMDRAEYYQNDFNVVVFDKQYKNYDDYTVEIVGTDNSYTETRSKKPGDGNDSNLLSFHLDDGTYRITITDNAYNGKRTSYVIQTSADLGSNVIFAYEYGADYVVSPGAVLTVLDTDGNVFTDYDVSVSYRGTTPTDGGTITDGVVGMSEGNYYNVILQQTGGQRTYLESFTVRVKAGAAAEFTYQSTQFEPRASEDVESKETYVALDDFLGSYMMNMRPEDIVPGQSNPEEMKLYTDADGNVWEYDRMALETTGTTTYYPFTGYTIEGDTITFTYDYLITYYGETVSESGTRSYRYEDGNLIDGDWSWYPMNDDLHPAFPQNTGADATDDSSTETEQGAAGQSGMSEISPYAEVVRDSESKYGKLEIVSSGVSTYYTGVFLVRLLDFDRDGTDELIIGHASKIDGTDFSAPAMDIWGYSDGSTVLIRENAQIVHGDVGRSCGYLELDGQYYLATGENGFEIDLKFLKLIDGNFEDAIELQYMFTGEDYSCMYNGAAISEDEYMDAYNMLKSNSVLYDGGISSEEGHSESELRAELQSAYEELGMV